MIKKTQIDFRNLFYQKVFAVDDNKNDFIEMNFKIYNMKTYQKEIISKPYMKYLMKMIIVYI